MSKTTFAFCGALAAVTGFSSASAAAPFKVFMISSTAVDHLAMSAAAREALPPMGVANDFTIDFTTDNNLITEANLARYDVFLQMHRAPFEIKVEQRAALENFVKSGKGWVGVHAAGLILQSGNMPVWDFYSDLIGKVQYVTHPMLQNGTVIMEDRTHPATRNMPASFQIRDEWYEFSANPRANVRVLGKADETSYRQVRPAGDHPLIWACEKYPRAIYIATGHDASDWQNASFNILIRDSLLWAAGRLGAPANDGGADAVDAPGVPDAPAVTDAGSGGTGGVGPLPGSGGAGGTSLDAAADSAVGAGGSGGGLPGSGGAGAQGTGGATRPAAASGGCSVASAGPVAGGTNGALFHSSFLVLIGLGLAARQHRRRSVSPRRNSLSTNVQRWVGPALLLALFLAGTGCGSKGVTPAGPKDSGTTDTPSLDNAMPVDVSSPDVGKEPIDTASVVDVGPPSGDTMSTPDAAAEAGEDAPLPKINVLAIGELRYNNQAEIHAPFVEAAKPWLMQLAAQSNMTVTFIESANTITDAMLANYNVILQLNFKPFGWNATAQAAFEKYITEGKGGWVGLHHAGLYGPAVTPASERPWTWFFNFLGQINYRNYIASFAQATVRVEEAAHPVFKGVPASFVVTTEEWYQWDKSPRPNVRVLANVDESTYMPNSNIKMGGDHPVVWSNEAYKAKNLYIFMGHHPNLFQNTAWTTLFRNAIFWAGTPK